MSTFLSSNGRISANFGNVHTKYSAHSYFKVYFYSIVSKSENSKNIFL